MSDVLSRASGQDDQGHVPSAPDGATAVTAFTHAAILGQLAEGVIVTDAQGRITLVNEAAAAIHGVARLDVEPSDYSDTYHLFTEDGRPFPSDDLALARAVRGEIVIGARWRIRRPDGVEVFAIGNAQPLRTETGEQIGAVLTVRDDTARRVAEHALCELNESLAQVVEERTGEAERARVEAEVAQLEAERASAAKSDFLAAMSHEIRTPLNGVIAVADLLAGVELPHKARAMVEIIRASGDTLQRLLSDILDMARIESGKITLETAPFQLSDMLRAVAGLYQLNCDEKGVRLRLHIAPDCEQSVVGDVVRTRQVITNLLSNAVKFTEIGEVTLSAQRLPNRLVRFTVLDTGVGFPMADKAKVLGRFEQADSSITRRFGGTGLGLSICCSLVELMDGRLDCDSVPGAGSRFWVDLPLEASHEMEREEPITRTRGEIDAPVRLLRVLIADDHPTNRRIVQLILEDSGTELTSVEDGAQAVDAFETGAFDLILMDMQMPVMDGLSALRRIRASEETRGVCPTPVIMLTANAMPDHIAAAAAAGASLHVSKPFTAAALLQAMDQALAA